MNTMSKASALLLGAALAAGLGGCKKHNEDITPAPVTAPNTATPATTPPPPATTEPAPAVPPAGTATPETTPPPAGSTTPGTSGTSGTEGATGNGQPPSTAPDRIDQPAQRNRRPTY